MRNTLKNLDFWGTTTSLLCAIHCAFLPFLLSFGLINSQNWMANPFFEFIILGLTSFFVYFSIIKPYFQKGSSKTIVLIALIGLFLVIIHHIVPFYQTLVVVIGGILIAVSHILNLKQIKHSHPTS